MRYFPMFLDMAGRRVLLAGGGEQVAQKARLVGRSDAELMVMSEALIPELSTLVRSGRATHVAADLDEEALAAADFVFIATEDDDLDAAIADHARAGGALVNMVDKPDQCDMITPALVDRDPVVVAIGTEGAAPVLAKEVKTRLEAMLSPRLGSFTEMLRARRPLIADSVDEAGRLAFWNWAAKGEPWRRWLEGDETAAVALIDAAAAAGAPPEDGAGGALTVIEAPDAADLTPLRAVQRLQDAAVVIHGPRVAPGLLDLCRRDAERVTVSACPRHGLGPAAAVRAALAKGAVVAIGAAACRSANDMIVAETIAAAPPLNVPPSAPPTGPEDGRDRNPAGAHAPTEERA